MMHACENNISVCLFGSAARSSTDSLSDRDLLVTARNLKLTRAYVQEAKSKGWSVALFSHARLERMAEAGSLFVQHLRMEGRVIQDAEHWLEDLLGNFLPKNSYEEDINRSFDLIRPLERIMNNGTNCHLASDLGYVFIRNYAINRLATQRVYLFDYRSILEELQGMQRFSDLCLNRLIDLRKGKHAYRAGITHVAEKNLGHEVASCVAEACPELNLETVSGGTGVRLFGLPYAVLRDCEAALLSKPHLGNLAGIDKGDLAYVWRLIKRPREYSWQIRAIDEQWIASANNLIRSGFNNNKTSVSKNASALDSVLG